MGIFWDLMQQDEIEEQKEKAKTLDERVTQLENDLANTRALLKKNIGSPRSSSF